MQFVFLGSNGVSQACLLTNVLQTWPSSTLDFAHRLILNDGAVPAIKDPGHDSELQTVSQMTSNVFSFVGNRCSSARYSLAPPTAHL